MNNEIYPIPAEYQEAIEDAYKQGYAARDRFGMLDITAAPVRVVWLWGFAAGAMLSGGLVYFIMNYVYKLR